MGRSAAGQWRWAVVVLSGWAALLVAGCALTGRHVEPPKVHLVNVKLEHATVFRQQFVATLHLSNPNDVSLPVKAIEYNVRVNGKHFADGMTDHAFTLPALGQTDVDVQVNTSVLDWVSQLYQINRSRPQHVPYRISGKLHLGSWVSRTIPFSHKGQIPTQGLFSEGH